MFGKSLEVLKEERLVLANKSTQIEMMLDKGIVSESSERVLRKQWWNYIKGIRYLNAKIGNG
jgi:hypothetical protein